MKIYTKTGDKGETSLYSGKRVPKNDPIIEAIGTVDECNCCIGSALSLLSKGSPLIAIRAQLVHIQHTLFDLGANIATPTKDAGAAKLEKTRFDGEGSRLLEKWIDEMDAFLPPLHTFILPGGHPCGAMLHLARSICRRAERFLTGLNKTGDVSEDVVVYINRLSDYLFMSSRYVNFRIGIPETPWEHHKKSN